MGCSARKDNGFWTARMGLICWAKSSASWFGVRLTGLVAVSQVGKPIFQPTSIKKSYFD